jgi:diguanylate cyclase (GGDEF)-like protein
MEARKWQIRRVRLAVAVSLLVLAFMTLGALAAMSELNQSAKELKSQRMEAFTLAWDVRLLDEVLTHSAAEYILTNGDQVWKNRYDDAVIELDRVLARLKEIEGDRVTRPLEEVDDANQELIRLETEAFAAVGRGESYLAGDLLSGVYDTQKRRYRLGLEEFFSVQQVNIERNLNRTLNLSSWLRIASILPGLTLGMAVLLIGRGSTRAARLAADRDFERDRVLQLQATEHRISRALDLAQNEAEVLSAVHDVLVAEFVGGDVELLLADSSRTHLRQAACTDKTAQRPGCGVPSPGQCPAIRRGFTMAFDDPTDYSSCSHLRSRNVEGHHATCVPVSLMGQSVGVVHAVAHNGIDAQQRQDNTRLLDRIANQVGDRVGVMRTLDRTQLQATTDPLTGLLNRRSLENRVTELAEECTTYSVALFDLDNFKQLNDTHGHATGDQAIRVFAKTLRDSLRTNDLICRWGGEEFLVVLPGSDLPVAKVLAERVNEVLARALLSGTTPPFTASAGVAVVQAAEGLHTLVARADDALRHSKASGRNRVTAADAVTAEQIA